MTQQPGIPREALQDVHAAQAVLAVCGQLTTPVLDAVGRWFSHVDIPLPIQAMSLRQEQYRELAAQVLRDLGLAIDRAGAASEGSCEGDQLWRELAGLHADRLNAAWQAIRPADDEDRRARVSDLQEAMGLTAADIARRAPGDQGLLTVLSCLGLTVDDLR